MRVRVGTGEYVSERRAVVTPAGDEIALSPSEARLLEYLAHHVGQVLDVRRILRDVWDWSARAPSRTVYVTVARLRDKIELDPRQPAHLLAPAAGGYRFEAEVYGLEAPAALPVDRDAFVGREPELAEVDDHLGAGARLVTLLGPGGAGKTRLAREWARRHPVEGLLWCELASLTTDSELIGALGRCLRLPAEAALDQAVAAALAARPWTLVLDDADAITGVLAARLDAWLARAGRLRVVVTSRVALRCRGEHVVAVGPLPLPVGDEDTDATALFVHRARQRDPRFAPSPVERRVIADIVRAVDGLPLGIELAAARVRAFGVEGVWRGLSAGEDLPVDADLSYRRHASLRAAVAWSWTVLGPPERASLAALAAWVGSFDLDGALAVLPGVDAGARFARLEALLDHSLVQAWPTPDGQRFRVPALVAAIAREAPEVSADVRSQANAAHGRFLAAAAPDRRDGYPLKGSAADYARRRWLDEHLVDVRLAAARAIARGEGVVAAGALWALWFVIGHRGPYLEGVEWADRVLAAFPADGAVRLVALDVKSYFLRAQGSGAGGSELADALALAEALGDATVVARLRARLLNQLRGERRLDEAAAIGEATLREGPAAGVDPSALLSVRANLAATYGDQARHLEAVALLTAVRDEARAARWRWAEAHAANQLGLAQRAVGALSEAAAAFEEARSVFAALDDPAMAEAAIANAAGIAYEQGRGAAALAAFEELFARSVARGALGSASLLARNQGEVLLRMGRLDEAEAALREAVTLAGGNALSRAAALARLVEVAALRGDAPAAAELLATAFGALEGRAPPIPLRRAEAVARLFAGDHAGFDAALAALHVTTPADRFLVATLRARAARNRGADPGPALAEARDAARLAVAPDRWHDTWIRLIGAA